MVGDIHEVMQEKLAKVKEERARAAAEDAKNESPFKVGDKVVPIGNSWCSPEWVKANSPAVVIAARGRRYIRVRWKCGLVDDESSGMHTCDATEVFRLAEASDSCKRKYTEGGSDNVQRR